MASDELENGVKEPVIPWSVEQNPTRAEEMAYEDERLREQIKAFEKLGLKDLARRLGRWKPELVDEAGERWDRIRAQKLREQSSKAQRIVEGAKTEPEERAEHALGIAAEYIATGGWGGGAAPNVFLDINLHPDSQQRIEWLNRTKTNPNLERDILDAVYKKLGITQPVDQAEEETKRLSPNTLSIAQRVPTAVQGLLLEKSTYKRTPKGGEPYEQIVYSLVPEPTIAGR